MLSAALVYVSCLNVLLAAEAPAEKILFTFGPQFDLAAVEAKDVTPSISGSALRMATGHKEQWPGITLKAPGDPWDLSAFTHVSLAAKNVGKNTVTVNCRVDSPGGDGAFNSVTRAVTLQAGTQQVLNVPLNKKLPSGMRNKLFGMHGYPGGYSDRDGLDASKVEKLIIFIQHPKEDHEFEIVDIKAEVKPGSEVAFPLPADEDKWFPMIDTLGQYIHKVWPGKLHDPAELQERKKEEAADLAAHPGPKDWDQYGGWKTGPQLKATGRFRTEKVDERWWLVDPEGHVFWSNGLDCVGLGHLPDRTVIDRRHEWFADLPEFGTPLAAFYGVDYNRTRPYDSTKKVLVYNFGAANLFRKYGDNWKQDFSKLVHRRLRSWGINTIANWSEESIYMLRKTPYVATVWIEPKALRGSGSHKTWFTDVFEPDYPQRVQKEVDKFKKTAAGDPWCLGYFVDNELPWGDDCSLSVVTLASPADQPAKKVFIDDLKAKYKTIERLNEGWDTKHASWEALLESTTPPKVEKARADLVAFYTKTADKYFQTCREAVKKLDPEGLYLGCRFFGYNDVAVREASKYCDVIGFNRYVRSVADFSLPEGVVDKPIIIGEFHFGALDRGLPHTGLVPTANQQERTETYKQYMLGAIKNPIIVGAHWFQYSDQPFTGRFDGENYQIGFVDICDTPEPEIIQACRELGDAMYPTRSGK